MSTIHLIEIIISFFCIILAFLNILHFLKRRKISKRIEQLYFIYIFIIYILISAIEAIFYILNVNIVTFLYFAYTWFILIIASLSAAGSTLHQKYRLSLTMIIISWIFTIISLNSFFNARYDLERLYEIIDNISFFFALPFGIVLTIILLVYTWETRLSSLIGLTLAVGIMLLYAFISDLLSLEHGRNMIRFIMLVIMLLGFKGKFSWFELTIEQKRERGIPIRIDELSTEEKIKKGLIQPNDDNE